MQRIKDDRNFLTCAEAPGRALPLSYGQSDESPELPKDVTTLSRAQSCMGHELEPTPGKSSQKPARARSSETESELG